MQPSGEVQIISDLDALNAISKVISSVQRGIDFYFDANKLCLAMIILSKNTQKLAELNAGGARMRFITEMNRENLAHCKDIMKHFKLFHTPCITGSFIIADENEFIGYLTSDKGDDKLLRILNRSFVDGQKFLVSTIIDKALPANQRILEIGRGTGEEFIETIKDHVRVKALISELIRSAVYEIAILFSAKNSFLMAEREGILQEISQASAKGVKVRVLVMQDEMVKEISNAKLKNLQDVRINYLQQLLPTRITTMIIDQAKSLTVEVNDDTKETLQEAIGLSTYSNSESTVFSNVSIFESLWIQSELDKQNKARQAYFQLFKGFKLKDEIYNRRWSSVEKKGSAKA